MKLHAAIFYTKNLSRIVEFYETVVGLPKAFLQGNVYAAFMFDNDSQLGIKVVDNEREIPGSQSAILAVEDIETLYAKLKTTDVNFYKDLEKASWGTTFSLLDPDGNKLEFVEN